ncbi:MAG: S8 family peptidase, partial [Longimicrobiales bacterium]
AALRVRAADLAAAAEVRAIVRIAPGGRAALERHGARIATVAGDVVTATLPLTALSALAQEPGVVFIEAAAWLDAPMPAVAAVSAASETESADDAQLDIVSQYRGTGFDGATGAGVIVGIYDSGVDLAHDDFLDDLGRTRVLYAWDQTVEGAPPGVLGASLFDYGYECTSAVIDAHTCPLRDNNGHGTHVAGIAAGDGSATGNGLPARRFIGAAPGADLIVVKGGDAGYTSDRLLDGVAYIFARAAALGRPAVVNLSLGTQSGPHDGSTVFERGLQNLLAAGRVIVAAAGNQGNNANEVPAFVRQSLHAMGDVDAGVQTHELVVPAYTAQPGMVNDAAVLELWYDGGDDLAVGVRAPSGALVARLLPGDSIIARSPEGAVFIDNAAHGADPNNGDRLALITIFDADAAAAPAVGAWRIEVERTGGTGSGAYHLWLVGSNLSTPVELPTLRLGTTNTHLVALPGTADRLITVGAHVARHSWFGPGSIMQNYPFQEQRGDIAHFSSPGPRRDGVLGLDLTAPGKVVVSARSHDAQLWAQLPSFVEADGQHAVLFGTSMATPYVAGTVALLLQYAPQLTPEQTRTLLVDGARSDEFTTRSYSDLPPAVPSVHWGYGKLDAAAALHALPIAGGRFAVAIAALPVPETVSARLDARTALLQLTVRPDSVEALHLQSLALTLSGDATGTVMIVEDVDGDGAIDGDEPVVGSMQVDFGAPSRVTVATDAVAARAALSQFLVGVALAPGTQHAAQFGVAFDPFASQFVGALSGDVNAWVEPPTAAASPLLAASVLAPDERWSLSENPVRSERVVLNFAEAARAVRVYTLNGRLVRELPMEQGTERIEWRLDNDDGALVASGVYLLLVEFADARVTRKLMVLR